jgi:hypothetical protein
MKLPQPTMFYILTEGMTFYKLGRFSSWDEAFEADGEAQKDEYVTLWVMSQEDMEMLFDNLVKVM